MSNRNQKIELGPWKPEKDQNCFGVYGFGIYESEIHEKDPEALVDQYVWNLFETEEEARQCTLAELATRKLKRYAKQLNPSASEWSPYYNKNGWFCVTNRYGSGVFHVTQRDPGAGEVPFHSQDACHRAWTMLTDEEVESLFYK